MILLIVFAFIAGIITILSPCILPILPIVLAGSVSEGKRRPLGIVSGFIASFTFFTLALSGIVKAIGIPADGLRSIAAIVIALFGISMVLPKFQIWMESAFSGLSTLLPTESNKNGFTGGVLVGISLGLLWAPCVGPILASVITLAATSTVNLASILITLAYSVGTAVPLLGITYGGRSLLNKWPWLLANSQKIQKIFGVLMITTAIAIFMNFDRTFQTYVLKQFPDYGTGLTAFEDNAAVRNALGNLSGKSSDTSGIGKPMNTFLEDTVGTAPELIAGGSWINSEPLTIQSLRGKVVLVDFWTYTCINCIRTLPYIRAWNEKYKDKGLVIIGVHTPEFAFERELKNVKKAADDFGLTYPIMQDNEYETWNAYDNHYWPAKYLIDKTGKIRDTHFGEGSYDETEKMIQKLLGETGITGLTTPANQEYTIYARTPELYLGYDRIAHFASAERVVPDIRKQYSIPDLLPDNTFAYGNGWTVGPEFAMPHAGAVLQLQFDAKDVYLVMRPKGSPGAVKIMLDGKLPGPVAGVDVNPNGIVTVDTDRLYTLIKLDSPGSHILRLEFPDDNTEIFAFTFG